MSKKNHFNTQKIWKVSVAALCSLQIYNNDVFASSSNHTSTSGDQVVDVSGLNINNDYYSYYTNGSIDLTITDTSIDTGGAYTQTLIAHSYDSSVDFNADNLTTQAGEIALSGDGNITADIKNSNLGATKNVGSDSIWMKSYSGNANVNMSNSVLDGRLDIDAEQNTAVNIESSKINQGVRVMSEGKDSQTNVQIKNSTITATNTSNTHVPIVHAESGGGGTTIEIDDSTIGLTADSTSAVSQDVEGFADNGGDSSIIVNNSTIQNGIFSYAVGSNSQIQINNSHIGTTETKDDVNYMLISQSSRGEIGNGNAILAINNSDIEGDITAQSQGDGNAQISLANNSVVNGKVRLVGSNMELDINNATLNGDIEASSYSESDINASGTNMTLNLSDTTYRGNIDSNDGDINENLTININNGSVIGGESLDNPMGITGYDSVNFNINYLSPTLVDTDKVSYFYLDKDESVEVNNGVANGKLAPIRSGSYILDDVIYAATDDSNKTDTSDMGKTWGVTFHTENPEPPAPEDVAADIQAAQAGIMASNDMIHRVADGITHELDRAQIDRDSHMWVQGIYAGGDHNADVTQYSNDITGFQTGGDITQQLSNNSVFAAGLALAYLHNDLDLKNASGHNNIDGTYYSLYSTWKELISDSKKWGWFGDLIFTYGDMSYDSSGQNGNLSSGGSYNGHSWLVQGRLGTQINTVSQLWFKPYITLGTDNIHTDSYNDGYSNVDSGKQDGGFYGAGIQAGTNYQLNSVELKPYAELGYIQQFDTKTNFGTDDYKFAGQNINGGNAGLGIELKFSEKWSTNASINNEFGQDIDKETNAYFGLKYKF